MATRRLRVLVRNRADCIWRYGNLQMVVELVLTDEVELVERDSEACAWMMPLRRRSRV